MAWFCSIERLECPTLRRHDARMVTLGRAPMSPIEARLERFVSRLGVPGAGIAMVDADGSFDAAVTGTTRRGHNEPVALSHQWHIGSCTKSITSAMYALLVQRGHARWETPVSELVADLADDIHSDWAIPTIDEVLQCRGGVRPNLRVRQLRQARDDTRSAADQRTATARDILRIAPARHGQFRYSNLGYVVVGAAIDRLAGSYEQALHDLILDPLGIDSAGLGPPPDIWGHQSRLQFGPLGIGHGRPSSPARPVSDNPAVYTPAGRLHLSLPDWATIVLRLFLDTDDRLLTAESIDRLLHVPDGNAMAMGWADPPDQMPRASAAMQGSNMFWAATGLLDTDRRRAVLLVTNDGRTRVLSGSARFAYDLLPQ
jgi:D-alanyl-D-alanine carboxypeptidase